MVPLAPINLFRRNVTTGLAQAHWELRDLFVKMESERDAKIRGHGT